ncbi:MAG: hypothetical protein ACO3C3_09815 [Burkholderiaceae bacterium]
MIDFYRDTRDMGYELAFYGFWSTPWGRAFGKTHESRRTLKTGDEVRGLPEVAKALEAIEQGGFAEAVIRMLVLLADNRGQVRRDRLERSSQVLTMDEPFKSLGAERRAMIIHQQTIIASFEPELAIETLAGLIHEPAERELAVQLVQYIPGSVDEMSADTIHLLKRFRQVLDLDTNIENVLENPLHASPRRHTDVYRALISEDHHESEALEAAIRKAPRATSARKPAKGKSTRRV